MKAETNRRMFLKSTVALTALSCPRIVGANNRIRLGLIGAGRRGTYVTECCLKTGGSELVAICDVYEPHRLAAQQKLAPQASLHLDHHEVLDRKDVDAVLICTPDHWHVPIAVDAVKAGKDVYCEKPLTHTLEEGDVIIKAVEQSGRVIQVGYQQRSYEHYKLGEEIIAKRKLGRITLAQTYWYQNRQSDLSDAQVDSSKLDWKRFLGNAPNQPLDPVRYNRWRWFWDFGGGSLTDLFSHWVDVVHWYMGSNAPRTTMAVGGNYYFTNQQCPDTIGAMCDYEGGFGVTYESTLISSLEDGGNVFRGTEGIMKITRGHLYVYPENVVNRDRWFDLEPELSVHSSEDGSLTHARNFLDCIRSRKAPNSTVPDAVAAARVAHLGNLSWRRGAPVHWPFR